MKNFTYSPVDMDSKLVVKSTAELQEQVQKEIESLADKPLGSGLSGFVQLPHTILGKPYEKPAG
jgi:hypothetical protein